MIEINYREHSEQADLADKSIAQARQWYKSKFDIPDKARARLNDKELEKRLESETILKNGDDLYFVSKSRKGLVLVGALVAALAATGGMFAYTQTSATVTLGVTAAPDFVTVGTANTTGASWTIFGKHKGTLPTNKTIFEIAPAAGYTGDLVSTIYLGNADLLVERYRVLVMRIRIIDSTPAEVVGTELLTLSKGEVEHTITTGTPPYYVEIEGGFYITHGFHGFSFTTHSEDPMLWCEVVQR